MFFLFFLVLSSMLGLLNKASMHMNYQFYFYIYIHHGNAVLITFRAIMLNLQNFICNIRVKYVLYIHKIKYWINSAQGFDTFLNWNFVSQRTSNNSLCRFYISLYVSRTAIYTEEVMKFTPLHYLKMINLFPCVWHHTSYMYVAVCVLAKFSWIIFISFDWVNYLGNNK